MDATFQNSDSKFCHVSKCRPLLQRDPVRGSQSGSLWWKNGSFLVEMIFRSQDLGAFSVFFAVGVSLHPGRPSEWSELGTHTHVCVENLSSLACPRPPLLPSIPSHHMSSPSCGPGSAQRTGIGLLSRLIRHSCHLSLLGELTELVSHLLQVGMPTHRNPFIQAHPASLS